MSVSVEGAGAGLVAGSGAAGVDAAGAVTAFNSSPEGGKKG